MAIKLAKGSNTEILRSYVRLSPSLFLRLRMTRPHPSAFGCHLPQQGRLVDISLTV